MRDLATFCFGAALGLGLGYAIAQNVLQKEAVKAGVGEWIPDPSLSGFRWKANTP